MGEQDNYDDAAALLQSLPKMAAYAVRQGNVSDDERRALFDALGHSDCVPRGWCDGYINDAEDRAERAEAELAKHGDCIDPRMVMAIGCLDPTSELQWNSPPEPVPCGNCPLCRADSRAERAEAERDALRADNERLREALERIDDPNSQIVVMHDGHPAIVPGRLREIARAALSADADADAEPTGGAQRIGAERQRQIAAEGYTPEHDQHHRPSVLMAAAECYLIAARQGVEGYPVSSDPSRLPAYVRWPWEPEGWKPLGGPERNLEKAGALVAAALDRCVADAEPSRPEGDEQPKSLNELSDEWGLCRPPCTKPAGHAKRCNAGAVPHRGGRPREADPQGNSPSTDASVDGGGDEPRRICGSLDTEGAGPCVLSPPIGDGSAHVHHGAEDVGSDPDVGGDDGRSRAIDAILATLPNFFREDAEAAIDAALASGGVVSAEYLQEWVGAYWKLSETRDEAQARVRQLEIALCEIVDDPAVRDPLGSLPPDSEWMQGARAEQERQQRRARAVLEGGSDG